jgi:hypothetical protein
MTRAISAVSTWNNGAAVSATQFFLKCINDDLDTEAVYYYEIRTAADVPVADGNLTMTGSDYTSRTDNDYTWEWAADELGLTLT